MRRWRTRILNCLFLGVVTTVAVAWGSAVWSRVNLESCQHLRIVPLDRSDANPLSADVQRRIAGVRVLLSLYGGSDGWSRPIRQSDWPREAAKAATHWVPRWRTPVSYTRQIHDARGWPFLALCGGFEINSADGMGTIERTSSAILIGPRANTSGTDKTMTRLIPLAPIWPGLFYDVLIFSACWFILPMGTRAARRTRRRSRGLCPMCAYDLRANLDAGCPECGWGRGDDPPKGGRLQ